MRSYILEYGCPIKKCCRRFTTEKFVRWHIISSHRIKEDSPNPIKLKPVEVTLDKSPADKGICVATCPKHKSIALSITKRHAKCYQHFFKCHDGCVFCKHCKMISTLEAAREKFEGGLLKTWKEDPKMEFETS